MTVKKKLFLSSILLIFLVLFIGIIVFIGYRHISHNTDIAYQLDTQTMYLQMMLRGLNEIILNEGTPDSVNIATSGLNGFESIHKDLLSRIENPHLREKLTYIYPKFIDIKIGIQPYLEQHYFDEDADHELLIRYGSLIRKTEHISNETQLLATNTKAQLESSQMRIVYTIALFSLGMLIVIGLYLSRLYKSITHPIGDLLSIADGFNKGDLSVKMDATRNDEFGSLATYFNNSIANLKHMSKKVEQKTDELMESNIQLQSEIAERMRAEEQTAAATQDWEDTFNSITDMITIHDRDHNIIRANKAAQEKLKLPEINRDEEIKCYSYYHGTDYLPEGCVSCGSLKTSRPETFEVFEPHLNTTIEIAAIPRLDKNDNLAGLIHVTRDISKRKHDEELIKTQLDRLSALRSIDKAILGSVDLRVVIDVFLNQVLRQLNIDAVAILLLNEKTQILKYFHSKGFRSGALKHTKLRVGESNAGLAAVERRIINVPKLEENLHGFESSKYFQDENFISYFAIPLIAKGMVKGVLEVFNRTELHADPGWLEFLEAIADQGAIAIDNSTMFDGLQRSNTELSVAYDNTIIGWSRAMDMRDKETEGHSQRVTAMTVEIASEMEIEDEELIHIRRGALLHDMGKLGVPDSILLKPGKLTEEEWLIMKMHPQHAYNLLHIIEHLRPALDIPLYHHEKWDGTGYPKGQKGEAIPLAARIFAVVDVYDALSSDRPYRSAWPKEKVIEHIRSLAGSHFDPEVVKVFMKLELSNALVT